MTERTPDGRRATRSDIGLSSALYTNGSANSSPVFRRHSSNFSDYSQDARDLLNPRPLAPLDSESMRHDRSTSRWDSLPLAFALLPAVGGLLVQDGSSFVTDLMLLCLGGIFLRWSVTQPWTWYYSAQEVRVDHEASRVGTDAVHDEQEEREQEEGEETENVVEENAPDAKGAAAGTRDAKERNAQWIDRQLERQSFRARQESALRELYRHEVLALLSCFACPAMGAYLLHALRDQLTRPSEGLISNFNLTVFLLGAEVRPLRHLLQLVQARTLHLQRIVHANPYREEEEQYRARRAQEESAQNQTLSDIVYRLECLERSKGTDGAACARNSSSSSISTSISNNALDKSARDALLRDVRAQIQPELDTLARALRHAHTQQALLESQVAHRFRATDQRLSDTVSIVAARQRPSLATVMWLYLVSCWAAAQWLLESLTAVLLYVPRRVAVCAATVAALPAAAVQSLIGGKDRELATRKRKPRRAPLIIGGTIRKKAVEADCDYDYRQR